jgi:septum formation protein
MRVILASGSPGRKELLSRLGVVFEVIQSSVDESGFSGKPEGLVRRLSMAKAQEVAGRLSGDFAVIGADTVVYKNGIMGKPKDADEAGEMLGRLSGRRHKVYTGTAVISSKAGNLNVRTFRDKTSVYMRKMSKTEIAGYAGSGEPMGKAGAYAAQGKAAAYIERVEGDYCSVVGLPVWWVYKTLKELGAV